VANKRKVKKTTSQLTNNKVLRIKSNYNKLPIKIPTLALRETNRNNKNQSLKISKN
jgi:hypothetical protein